MHVLRWTDPARYRMGFLVRTTEPQAYDDDEVRRLGGRIIPCLSHRNTWEYARNFGKVMREYAPYEVVHSHMYHFSRVVLRLAARHGVAIRIAHSHNDYRLWSTRKLGPGSSIAGLMHVWIRRHAIARLGFSRAFRRAAPGADRGYEPGMPGAGIHGRWYPGAVAGDLPAPLGVAIQLGKLILRAVLDAYWRRDHARRNFHEMKQYRQRLLEARWVDFRRRFAAHARSSSLRETDQGRPGEAHERCRNPAFCCVSIRSPQKILETTHPVAMLPLRSASSESSFPARVGCSM